MLFGDGSTRRDFIHVDDVADAVERLARIPDGVRVLNVGSGRSESVAEVEHVVAEHLGIGRPPTGAPLDPPMRPWSSWRSTGSGP